MKVKATWIRDSQQPIPGTRGTATKMEPRGDFEEGAWCFQPEGSDEAYLSEPGDWEVTRTPEFGENPPVPEVGMPATICYPQDRYPYVVTAVGKDAKSIKLLPLNTSGLEPSGTCNGFNVFDCEVPVGRAIFTDLPRTARRRQDGR